MVLKAILIGFITALGYSDYFFGATMVNRPLVLAPLVGLILGDVHTGIIVGASLELIFMGIVSIGSATPPDIVTGSVLGTAFAIISGKGAEVALTLAVPISIIAQLVKMSIYVVRSGINHKADKYAEDGNIKAVERLHYLSFALMTIPMWLLTSISFMLGSRVMTSVLNSIPSVITDGLKVATGFLPALGFALLINMMISKKYAPFFFLGFVLATYLKIPIMGIAILGVIIAILIMSFNGDNKKGVKTND